MGWGRGENYYDRSSSYCATRCGKMGTSACLTCTLRLKGLNTTKPISKGDDEEMNEMTISKLDVERTMTLKSLLEKEGMLKVVENRMCQVLVDGKETSDLDQKITKKSVIAIVPQVEGGGAGDGVELSVIKETKEVAAEHLDPKKLIAGSNLITLVQEGLAKKDQCLCPLIHDCYSDIKKEDFFKLCESGKYKECRHFKYSSEFKMPFEWLELEWDKDLAE